MNMGNYSVEMHRHGDRCVIERRIKHAYEANIDLNYQAVYSGFSTEVGTTHRRNLVRQND